MSMSFTNYDQRMRELLQQKAEERAQETPDPEVAKAQRVLESAQAHHANEQHIQATLNQDPRWFHWTPAQQMNVRGQMSDRVFQAKQAVEEAQKAVWSAENTAARKRREAKMEAEKAEKQRQREEEEAAQAAQVEAQAKAQFRAAWAGLDADFEQAWPGMWTTEKKRRARAQVEAQQTRMRANYANYF